MEDFHIELMGLVLGNGEAMKTIAAVMSALPFFGMFYLLCRGLRFKLSFLIFAGTTILVGWFVVAMSLAGVNK